MQNPHSYLDALVFLAQVSAAGPAPEGDRGGQEDDEAGPPGDELAIPEEEGLEAADDAPAKRKEAAAAAPGALVLGKRGEN